LDSKHKVLIMRCDTYDPDRIAGIIKDGMQELGVVPFGRILLKPNGVLAKVKDPNFHPSLLVPVNLAYWQMRFFRFLNRFLS
jgi:hypothetical protein